MAKDEEKRHEAQTTRSVDRSYMLTWGSTVSNKADFEAEAAEKREEQGEDDRPIVGVNPVIAPDPDAEGKPLHNSSQESGEKK